MSNLTTSKKQLSPKLRCQSVTSQGLPCRAWAAPGSQARFGRTCCHHHAPPEPLPPDLLPPASAQGGLYSLSFTLEEHTALEQAISRACGDSLVDEIQTVRIMLRRLLAHFTLLGRPTTADLTSLTPLVLASAQTIAQLLKDERLLSADGAGKTMTALDMALDELAEEWGIEI